jgi:hypothetical protein
MQSLATSLTTAQLDSILATLARLPSIAVNRHTDIITVTATRKADRQTIKVLSAATHDGQQWHVMAVAGLISSTFNN